MTREEAKAYFEECNDGIITASKDENVYDYEKQEIMSVFMRRTYEANAWAISTLSEKRPKGEWTEHEEDFFVYNRMTPIKRKIRECSLCHAKIWHNGKMNFCIECGADMRGDT